MSDRNWVPPKDRSGFDRRRYGPWHAAFVTLDGSEYSCPSSLGELVPEDLICNWVCRCWWSGPHLNTRCRSLTEIDFGRDEKGGTVMRNKDFLCGFDQLVSCAPG